MHLHICKQKQPKILVTNVRLKSQHTTLKCYQMTNLTCSFISIQDHLSRCGQRFDKKLQWQGVIFMCSSPHVISLHELYTWSSSIEKNVHGSPLAVNNPPNALKTNCSHNSKPKIIIAQYTKFTSNTLTLEKIRWTSLCNQTPIKANRISKIIWVGFILFLYFSCCNCWQTQRDLSHGPLILC